MSWFQHQDEWAAIPADDGPDEWQRIDVEVDPTRSDGLAPGASGRKIDIVQPVEAIVPKELPCRHGQQRAAGRSGSPVHRRSDRRAGAGEDQLLPELACSGAKGPYRIAPNLMVVVPDLDRCAPDVRTIESRLLRLHVDVPRHRPADLHEDPRRRAPRQHPSVRQRDRRHGVGLGRLGPAVRRALRRPHAGRAVGSRRGRSARADLDTNSLVWASPMDTSGRLVASRR